MRWSHSMNHAKGNRSAFLAELKRRSDEIDRSEVLCIPWEDVRKRTRERWGTPADDEKFDLPTSIVIEIVSGEILINDLRDRKLDDAAGSGSFQFRDDSADVIFRHNRYHINKLWVR